MINISIGQVIILFGIIAIAIYILRSCEPLNERILGLFMVVVGCIITLVPAITSMIANWLGIGRGADLVFYCFILLSIIMHLNHVSHVNKLEQQITKLVRELAIQDVIKNS
jgi:hypothetical protein